MHDDETIKTCEYGDGAGSGINRRQFLQVGAVLGGGILGAGFNIADAIESDRKVAPCEVRILGCKSDTSTGGCFDKSIPPVLRITSGDTVAIETGTRRAGGMVPGSRGGDWTEIYKEEIGRHPDVYFPREPAIGVARREASPNRMYLAGPIHVEGAEPGDVLQIEISGIPPPRDDFTKDRRKWFWEDLKNNAFGNLPAAKILTGKHAGAYDRGGPNADTALTIPIQVKGAGVVTGDFRFVQEEGEFHGSGLEEACRKITLRMTVRKDLKLADLPFISTPNHWIALGIRTDMREAFKLAVRKSIRVLDAHCGIPDDGGYVFCSMGAGRHVTQYVMRNAILTHLRR
jgi:acetamidase/formamidase